VRKKLSCSDIGLDCFYMVTATAQELVMETALKHISEIHIIKPEEITSEMIARMKASIRDEEASLWFR
jgi:predicted small metal-binding protein